jgi:carboxypeptidase C (cathepsin A)
MLYLEQPAGVGFSVGLTSKDTNHSDYSQSVDTFKAVQKFYEKFPEYMAVDLFVSGESYGGIYVPYLTW